MVHLVVQVAKIECERLIADIVDCELKKRKAAGAFLGSFSSQCHYFGYEGRCPPPSNFDCNYCYALGLTAGALIGSGCTGMMASVKNLIALPEEWSVHGAPLTSMIGMERRKGKEKPVIRKVQSQPICMPPMTLPLLPSRCCRVSRS